MKELDLRDNNITNLGAESLKSIPGNMTILVDGNLIIQYLRKALRL
ncbi:hypothetical protein [Rickettsia rhipicephali]|nr:hypothetical protein [Rickettsia rhipicephali]